MTIVNDDTRSKMNQKIIEANPKVRLATTAALGVAAVASLGGLFVLRAYLADQLTLMETNAPAAMDNVLGLVYLFAVLMGAGALLLAAYFGYLAMRIRSTGQFPPPGAMVLKDTPLLTGAAARRRGWIAAAASLMLIVAGTAGTWFFQHSVHRVMKSGAKNKPAPAKLAAPAKPSGQIKS